MTKEYKPLRTDIRKQIDLQEEIQKHDINLVTCGDCGSPMFHRTTEDEIKCPFCGFTSEPCDFPDYFYSGMETSAEFRDSETIEEIEDKVETPVEATFSEEITVTDPVSKLPVELSVFKSSTGGMFAVDSSFIEQNFDDTDTPIVPDPMYGASTKLNGI